MSDGLQSVDASADNVATAAAATNVVKTFPAIAGTQHLLPAIIFSYSDTPTGGRLTVEDGAANIVFDLDITAAGAARVKFSPFLRGAVNTAMIVTLYSGGAAVVGKLNTTGHYTQG